MSACLPAERGSAIGGNYPLSNTKVYIKRIMRKESILHTRSEDPVST